MSARSMAAHTLWICWKDLLEFSRNRLGLVMLIVMPLLMMAMVGFIFPSSGALSNTPVAIADLDSGVGNVSLGPVFVAQLNYVNNQTGMMSLEPAQGFDDIASMIQKGKVSGGIIVEENFTANMLSGEQAYVTIVTDQANPQMSSVLQQMLTQTINSMGVSLARLNLNSTFEVPMNQTTAMITPYKVEIKGTVPGNPSYFQFMAPGVMAMVVMMSMMTGLPHAISYEKEMGTMDGLMVAPVRRLSIILGKVLAQITRGMLQGVIILVLSVLVFDVVIYGSVWLVFFIMLLSVFSFTGLGIVITSFTDSEETATMVMMTLMFPMMFLSGVFFPIEQMPWYMQAIAMVLPLTYATTALRDVMVLGANFQDILPDVTYLAVFGVVLLAIAIPLFRKGMSR